MTAATDDIQLRLSDPEIVVTPFIEGVPVASASDSQVNVINPSNGRRAFSIPAGCDDDVNQAVASARSAFDEARWRDTAPSLRMRVLHRLADLIDAEAAVLDRLDAVEMGKPVSMAYGNAASAARMLRFYAEAVDKITGDTHETDARSTVLQRRVPRGVIAAVTPWNFPVVNAVRKVGPALAAGNCVVLKPSELSSRSAIRLAELAIEAGLPPGVLNIVPGLGETVGKALGLHMDVDMLTFTGSTVVGKSMLEYAAHSNMKVVMAECGGKSPQIVFDDGVSLDDAAARIAHSLVANSGQICSMGSRLLVQRSIEAPLLEKIIPRLHRIIVGDALDPKTTFGPLVSAKQCARVMQYIESAPRDGAQVVAGGRRVLSETGGYFVEPTVLRNVSPTARVAQEEIFGPVLSVIPFEDEAEAVRIANSTIYGLAAYVWTAKLSTGMRMMKQLRSSVWVNATAPVGEGAGHAASFEPAGQSGLGVEGGLAGMESYLRRQLVWINHA